MIVEFMVCASICGSFPNYPPIFEHRQYKGMEFPLQLTQSSGGLQSRHQLPLGGRLVEVRITGLLSFVKNKATQATRIV
jgi:hypothetical protein